jgi:hypothetical protein
MKTKAFFILLTATLLTAPLTYADDEPAPQQSNTRWAKVEVTFVTDPQVMPLADETNLLDIVLSRTESSAEKKIFGKTGIIHKYANVMIAESPITIGGMQRTRLYIDVLLDETQKPIAKEFLEAYIQILKKTLNSESSNARQIFTNKLSRYYQQMEEAEIKLHHLLQSQGKLDGGRGTLDKASVRNRIMEHEKARIENDLQQSILKRRQAELVKLISEANSSRDEAAVLAEHVSQLQEQNRQFIAELRKLDEKRKSPRLYDISLEKEQTDDTENLSRQIAEIEMNIHRIQTEIQKISERKHQIQTRLAEDTQQLNQQLRETTLKLQELDIEERVLAGYGPGSIKSSLEYELLEAKIQAARESLIHTTTQAQAYKTEVNLIMSPTVTHTPIISAETAPEPQKYED